MPTGIFLGAKCHLHEKVECSGGWNVFGFWKLIVSLFIGLFANPEVADFSFWRPWDPWKHFWGICLSFVIRPCRAHDDGLWVHVGHRCYLGCSLRVTGTKKVKFSAKQSVLGHGLMSPERKGPWAEDRWRFGEVRQETTSQVPQYQRPQTAHPLLMSCQQLRLPEHSVLTRNRTAEITNEPLTV